MDWTDHACDLAQKRGRLKDEPTVISEAEAVLKTSHDPEDDDWDPTDLWPLWLAIAIIGAVGTAIYALSMSDTSWPILAALLAGAVVAIAGIALVDEEPVAWVLASELAIIVGALVWRYLDDPETYIRIAAAVGATIVAGVIAYFALDGLVWSSPLEEPVVWNIVTLAVAAVGWWGGWFVLRFGEFWLLSGVKAALLGGAVVTGFGWICNLVYDTFRSWRARDEDTGTTVRNLVEQLSTLISGLAELRYTDDPAVRHEQRLDLITPTERAARIIGHHLGRSLSSEVESTGTRSWWHVWLRRRRHRAGWVYHDMRFKGEAIRDWRRELILPSGDNADRLRNDAVHVMAHVLRWEWGALPSVAVNDMPRRLRRRRIRLIAIVAVMIAPAALILAEKALPFTLDSTLRDQLLPFALALVLAAVGLISGSSSLRDIGSSFGTSGDAGGSPAG